MYVNKIEIYKFKAKNIVIWYNVLLGSVSQDFARDEQNEISLNGTAYDFSFHHSSINPHQSLNKTIYRTLIVELKVSSAETPLNSSKCLHFSKNLTGI